MDEITKQIENSNDAFIQGELRPFLRIPSNTINKEGINEARSFLHDYISIFSEEIHEIPGEINPLILASVKGRIKEQLLIYMMYDTQPINKEEEWLSEPFEADVRQLPPPLDVLGNCMIARGAYNSKTPLLCFLNVVKILKNNGALPVSLLLLFDGEEEIGSPTLLKILKNNKDRFKQCVDAFYPSTKQDLKGTSIVKLGYKGILSITIKVFTDNKNPHSAFSSMIPNPAADLVSLLNTIYSKKEFQIDCLKEKYVPTEEETLILDKLIPNIDLELIKNKAGILQTLEKDPHEAFKQYLFNPTFNISTIKSGYLEEGIKNVVANSASCNIDIRFAHDISLDEIFSEIREKTEEFAQNSRCQIILEKNVGYEGSRTQLSTILAQSLIESFKELNVDTEVWPLSAAAAPLSKIKSDLRLNFIVGGLGIGGFAHSPNEFIQLSSILNTRLSNMLFLELYSKKIVNNK